MRTKQDYENAFKVVQEIAEMNIKEKDDRIAGLKETIKGLDRATVEYTHIIADKDVQLANREVLIKSLTDRLAYVTEAQASVPTRDVNGTIEAQSNRIRNLEAVIKQYRTEMQTLQRKVAEQDETIATWKEQPST